MYATKRWVCLIATVAIFSSGPSAIAETVSATGTVEAVDAARGTVTVRRKTVNGEKTATLTVGTAARIVDETAQPTELGSLAKGDHVELAYDTESKAITRIRIVRRAAQGRDSAAAAGGVPLFNGDDLEGWSFVTAPKLKRINADLRFDECWGADAQRHVLFATGKGHTWLESAGKYDDFVLSLEWRFVPGAQRDPNGGGVVIRASGIHSWGIDPRGIEVDLSEEHTGAFICYGTPLANGKKRAVGEGTQLLDVMREPELNQHGEWNSITIRCQSDRITVSVNGKQVNEGSGARAKQGAICLRSQSSAIEYRNVRLTPINVGVSAAAAARSLVGDSLDGWRAYGSNDTPKWLVEDGVLVNYAQGPWLATKEEFGDFDLHLEFSLPPECNSGIYLRGRYEIQLIDSAARVQGRPPKPVQRCGAIYGQTAPSRDVYKGPNQWNTLDVRIEGKTVTVRMNEVTVIREAKLKGVTQGAPFKDEPNRGPIALQSHGVTGAKFRNITVTPR